jgi:hypothetical protein
MSTVACDERCISNVGKDLGCDEYIHQRYGRFRKIKAAGDEGRRLTGSGFGAHFTRIDNITIWVKWPPNLASLAPAFYVLRTHARQRPNLRPLPSRELLA